MFKEFIWRWNMPLSGPYEGACCFRLIKLNSYRLVDISTTYWRAAKKRCHKNHGMLLGMISACMLYVRIKGDGVSLWNVRIDQTFFYRTRNIFSIYQTQYLLFNGKRLQQCVGIYMWFWCTFNCVKFYSNLQMGLKVHSNLKINSTCCNRINKYVVQAFLNLLFYTCM